MHVYVYSDDPVGARKHESALSLYGDDFAHLFKSNGWGYTLILSSVDILSSVKTPGVFFAVDAIPLYVLPRLSNMGVHIVGGLCQADRAERLELCRGADVVPWRLCSSMEQAVDFLRSSPSGLIVKHPRLHKAYGVHFVFNVDDIDANWFCDRYVFMKLSTGKCVYRYYAFCERVISAVKYVCPYVQVMNKTYENNLAKEVSVGMNRDAVRGLEAAGSAFYRAGGCILSYDMMMWENKLCVIEAHPHNTGAPSKSILPLYARKLGRCMVDYVKAFDARSMGGFRLL